MVREESDASRGPDILVDRRRDLASSGRRPRALATEGSTVTVMTADADLLNQLTVDDYARIAFSIDPEGFGEGGVYAGPLEHAPDAKPWHGNYVNPDDREVAARARLLSVPVGKVFVRWARSDTMKSWTSAAGGAWWVTDNMANRIVAQTVRRFGKRGDSNIVAREHAQVKHAWSDMGTVVVCRTTRPIKVLFGVGRPVPSIPGVDPNARDELQVVILTTVASPKNTFGRDPRNRFHFIGDQFMSKLWLGSSIAFTDWWERSQIVDRRRVAQRILLRGR
jgi:hypothetical protein